MAERPMSRRGLLTFAVIYTTMSITLFWVVGGLNERLREGAGENASESAVALAVIIPTFGTAIAALMLCVAVYAWIEFAKTKGPDRG